MEPVYPIQQKKEKQSKHSDKNGIVYSKTQTMEKINAIKTGINKEGWQQQNQTEKQNPAEKPTISLDSTIKAYDGPIIKTKSPSDVDWNDVERLINTPDIDFAKVLDSIGNIHEFFQKRLSDYYEPDAYLSPRVQNFLSWLKKNEDWIIPYIKGGLKTKKIKLDVKNEAHAAYLIGFIAGGLYLCSLYKSDTYQKMPAIESWYAGAEYDINFHRIYVSVFPTDSPPLSQTGHANYLISGINDGIHEYTHVLPIINNLGAKPLSELAPFFILSNKGLPLSSSDCNSDFLSSMRNIANFLYEERSGRGAFNLAVQLEDEHFEFMCGPWVKKFYSDVGEKPDIFSFIPSSDKLDFFYKIYLRENLSWEQFCNGAGITNQDLRDKFKIVFEKLKEAQWLDMKEFLQHFERIMDEVFGKPIKEDVPDGYVMDLQLKDPTLAFSQ